jgi:hypothetical protein
LSHHETGGSFCTRGIHEQYQDGGNDRLKIVSRYIPNDMQPVERYKPEHDQGVEILQLLKRTLADQGDCPTPIPSPARRFIDHSREKSPGRGII